MKFPKWLVCLCFLAIIVALGVVFVILNNDSLFDPSNSRAKESYENDFSTVKDTLSKPIINGRTKGGSSTSGIGVADPKPIHQAMSGGHTMDDSSLTPEVPIWFPDGTLVPQPQQRTLEEDVALSNRFIEFYDEDPSTIGVVDRGGGKYFPLYPNTVYVTRKMGVNEEGRAYLVGQTSFGTADVPDDGPIPAGVSVIELSPEGDPIREYIASGDWREFLLEQGVDPTQLEDILAELEKVGDPTKGANTAVVDAMNDEGIADMVTYPDQTDDFAENYPHDEVDAESSDQSTRADREQRLRSLMRKLELEDEEYRQERENAETVERQIRPQVREEPDNPEDILKRGRVAGNDRETEEESGKYASPPD